MQRGERGRIERRFLRRSIAFVVGALVAALVLEVVLQIGALYMHLGAADAGAASRLDGEAPVALCVGDSFTFGLHATSSAHSYPALAQARAEALGEKAPRFVNRGVPGQSSRDVLLALDADLGRHRPDVVYVLVGTNDHTFRPEPVRPHEFVDAQDRGFAWRLRTWRMLQLLGTAWGEPATSERHPFVGVWHANAVEFELTADGVMRLADQRWAWEIDAVGQLAVQLPDGKRMPIQWRRDGTRLRVACALWDPPILFEPGPMPGPVSEILREHLRQIVHKVRAAGARCVLLTYPGGAFARPGLNEDIRAAAVELGVDLIDVEARFSELAASEDTQRLYVADGHCSDLGNAVIAELCAADARR